MSCKCRYCSIAQDLPRFVLPAYVPVFLELMALPPFLDKARARIMWKGYAEIPETIKGSSEDKLRTFINHKHIVIKTRQQSQQHNDHNNTTTIAIQFVVAQSVHTYCIFHLIYTVVMAQETLLRRCTYCWPLVVVYLFLQVIISRIAKRSLVSFVSLFRLLLPVLAMATPPALPAPGRNATAALAVAGTTRPEEMVIHSGAATTEGDMSYSDEDFDPCRTDPR